MHRIALKRLLSILLCILVGLTFSFAQVSVFPNEQKVCYNGNAMISLINQNDTDATFLWQDSTLLGWNSIILNPSITGLTNDTLFISNATILLNNRKFRCIVDSAGLGIKFDTTSASILFVRAPITKPIIGTSQNICFGSSRDTVKIIQFSQGGDTSFKYQWQESYNGTTWLNILNNDSSFVAIDTLQSSRYYRLKSTSNSACAETISDSIYIQLYPKLLKPKLIKLNIQVCYQDNPDSVETFWLGNQYLYQWQISTDSINFINILNDTTNVKQSVQSITTKTFYRLRVTDKNGCGILFSDTMSVVPFSPKIKPTITGTQTLCFDETPDTLKITTHPSIGNDVKYQWQSSINGTSWVDISNQTGKALALTKNGSTKFYRIKATWPRNCGVMFTDSVLVSVYSQLVTGIIKTNQNICFNSTPGILTFQTMASGGGDNFSYQWQISTDSLLFVDIPSADGISYQPPTMSSTSFFRVKITSLLGCGVVNSNVIKINVYPDFIAPTVSANDTICFNSRTDTLYLSVPAVGGNGLFSYQWQQSTNNVVWQSITGQTANKFRPPAITSTMYYRVVTSSNAGCGVKISNAVTIKVWPNLQKPRISGAQNICFNAHADTLRLTQFAQGADNNFAYQWQLSSDGIVWSNIPNQTTLKLAPGALSSTKFYRIQAISTFGCGTINSDSIKINVYGDLNAGTIQGAQTICYDSIPSILEFNTMPNGGGDLYSYQWQESTDSINYTNINGANSTTLQLSNLKVTKFFRIRVTATLGCGTVFTNGIKVRVYNKYEGATIGNSFKICYGYIPVPLFMTQKPKGGSGVYEYQWQNSTDSINWSDIVGQTNETLPMTQSLVTNYYRLINNSTLSCGRDTSNIVEIIALKLPDTTGISGLPEVCRNQQELFYSLESNSSEYSYEWNINKGKILTEPERTAVFITWNDEVGVDTIEVKQTNIITGCFNIMKLPVQLKPDPAPSKTSIIRKSSTNILVCNDTSANLNYQWGFIRKSNLEYTDIPNSNLRYVQLPHTFDSLKYIYYVKTWFTSCTTASFLNFNPLSIGINKNNSSEIKVYPNPSNSVFNIDGVDLKSSSIWCYDVLGKLIPMEINSSLNQISFNESVIDGVYFLIIKNDQGVYKERILLRK